MKTLWTLQKTLSHTTVLVLLPFLVGAITAYFAEVSEVSETLHELIAFCAFLLAPILLLQLAGIGHKTRLEVKLGREQGRPVGWIEAGYRHARVLTAKGYFLLAVSLVALVCALAAKWAQFGVMCVLGLTLVYVTSTVGIVVSAFFVRVGGGPAALRGGRITREMSPAVVSSGEEVEERVHLERVPVPLGFHLAVEERLPGRLETSSRHIASSTVSSRPVTLSGPVRRTPRGLYSIGPAQIWYQDILGLTRVAVAQAAQTTLKILPRFRPVALGEPPRSVSKDEDVLSVVSRSPTEDFFRFREYMPRDDTRRINWKLTMKLGRLHIRVPESVPVSRRSVRLILDSYLPPGLADAREPLEDVLDELVEAWISLAKALVERGEQVTLVGSCVRPGKEVSVEELRCKRGSHLFWADLGSAACWQSRFDVDALLSGPESQRATPGRPRGPGVEPVVVTTRFFRLPDLARSNVTWVYLPPSRPPEKLPGPSLKSFLMLPFPTGAEENSWAESLRRHRLRNKRERLMTWAAEAVRLGAQAAEAQIRSRGEPVYRLETRGAAYVLSTR